MAKIPALLFDLIRPKFRFFRLFAAITIPTLTACDKVKTLAPAPPQVPLPPLAAREIAESEYPSFIDQPGKLVVLLVYHLRGAANAEYTTERLSVERIERLAARYSDVVMIGRVDADQAKFLKSGSKGAGIPGIAFYQAGKKAEDLPGGVLSMALIEDVMTRHAEDLRKRAPTPAPSPAPTPEPAPGTPAKPLIVREKKDALPPGMERQRR